jgi:hypothetical protein
MSTGGAMIGNRWSNKLQSEWYELTPGCLSAQAREPENQRIRKPENQKTRKPENQRTRDDKAKNKEKESLHGNHHGFQLCDKTTNTAAMLNLSRY